MLKMFSTVMALALLVSPVQKFVVDPMEDIYDALAKAKAETRSLIVEFDREICNRIEKTPTRGSGLFKLAMTAKGDVSGSLTITPVDELSSREQNLSGLLVDDKVFEFRDQMKLIREYDDGQRIAKNLFQFGLFPALILADRKEAEANFDIEVVKQDQWYTYILMQPKKGTQERNGWWFHVTQLRVVLMNKKGDSIPQFMPRQVGIDDVAYSTTIDIKSWKMNSSNGPQPGDFTVPVAKEGWQLKKVPGFRFMNSTPATTPLVPVQRIGPDLKPTPKSPDDRSSSSGP